MAFFMDPGAMFLGCLGPSEQKFLVTLIETAAKSGYTRFVEPCAGTFAMANLAVQNGFKPEQIETSDVNMMSTVLGYAITGQSLEPLEIHAQGFSDEELLDPATALYAQLYLRTSKNAGNDYFYQILTDLRLRREEHIESSGNVNNNNANWANRCAPDCVVLRTYKLSHRDGVRPI